MISHSLTASSIDLAATSLSDLEEVTVGRQISMDITANLAISNLPSVNLGAPEYSPVTLDIFLSLDRRLDMETDYKIPYEPSQCVLDDLSREYTLTSNYLHLGQSSSAK